MKSLFRTFVVAAVMTVPFLPALARAQNDDGSSLPQCQGWSKALETGGPGALKVLTEGWLGGCKNIGPQALASAITRLHLETDASLLWTLATRAGHLEHPLIFDAALRVAGDRSASIPARASSLLILSGQLGASLSINRVAGPILLTESRPATGVCGAGTALSVSPDPASEPLVSDAPRRVARVVDPLRWDARESTLLRNLARCVRSAVGQVIPPQIDVSGVRLRYTCGTDFIVSNPTPAMLPVTLEVEGTSDRESYVLKGGEDLHIWMDAIGTVRVIYDGTVIQSTPNAGVPCH